MPRHKGIFAHYTQMYKSEKYILVRFKSFCLVYFSSSRDSDSEALLYNPIPDTKPQISLPCIGSFLNNPCPCSIMRPETIHSSQTEDVIAGLLSFDWMKF